MIHYDLSDIQKAMSFVRAAQGEVVISDEVEGNRGTLRLRSRESSGPNIFGELHYENRNPDRDVRWANYRGANLISMGQEDGAIFERSFALPPGQTVTFHLPTKGGANTMPTAIASRASRRRAGAPNKPLTIAGGSSEASGRKARQSSTT